MSTPEEHAAVVSGAIRALRALRIATDAMAARGAAQSSEAANPADGSNTGSAPGSGSNPSPVAVEPGGVSDSTYEQRRDCQHEWGDWGLLTPRIRQRKCFKCGTTSREPYAPASVLPCAECEEPLTLGHDCLVGDA